MTGTCQRDQEGSPAHYVNSFMNKMEWWQNIISYNESKLDEYLYTGKHMTTIEIRQFNLSNLLCFKHHHKL
jgi:hypothetical protein